jgi:hypothetical protein
MIMETRFFGSFVRGDDDSDSDIDLLVVCDEWSDTLEIDLIALFPPNRRQRLSPAWYGPAKLTSMFADGDLFAWHLFKESRSTGLHGDFLAALFPPAPYTGALETVRIFETLLREVAEEVRSSELLVTYEAGLLYSAARNIAMAASWHSKGGLNFSRNSPYSLSGASLSPFVPQALYDKLVSARISGQRGGESPFISTDDLAAALTGIENWIVDVRRLINEPLTPSWRGSQSSGGRSVPCVGSDVFLRLRGCPRRRLLIGLRNNLRRLGCHEHMR